MQKIDPSIRDYIRYEPETGKLYRSAPRPKIRVGDEAGTLHHSGYRHIKFNNKLMNAHRIAWFLHYSEDPNGEIDHINGIKDDNRIENLRVVSHRENTHNRVEHRNGGLPGCYFNKQHRKWMARIWIDGKCKYIGVFSNKQDAHEAYLNALEAVC